MHAYRARDVPRSVFDVSIVCRFMITGRLRRICETLEYRLLPRLAPRALNMKIKGCRVTRIVLSRFAKGTNVLGVYIYMMGGDVCKFSLAS
jgi:hypothetical protein